MVDEGSDAEEGVQGDDDEHDFGIPFHPRCVVIEPEAWRRLLAVLLIRSRVCYCS